MIRTAPQADYDRVILGASHAAVFDFDDMNGRLEQMTGARILNLSVVGGGVVVNRLLLDYFLVRHRTEAIVYVVDSFAFYSSEWNEERLEDARLFQRAPFDPALARLLAGSGAPPMVALDYVSGFSKINNPDRFAPIGRRRPLASIGDTGRSTRSTASESRISIRPSSTRPFGQASRATSASSRRWSPMPAREGFASS